MHVSAILQAKGAQVHCIGPGTAVAEAVRMLRDLRIGALVVSDDGETVGGILSERDVVRGLADEGAAFLERTVSEAMTADVTTCEPGDTGRGVLGYMTELRVRHVPVVEDGRLAGMISIGDVVKSRLDEIMQEAETLREYISRA